MKRTAVIFVGLALAVSFGLGRATAPLLESELASVASFQRSLEDRNWLTRSYRFSSFLVGLNPENLPDALEALEPHLQWLNTDEFRLFMLAWARFDPSGAFEHARSWPLEVRRKGGAAAMYAWGFYSPLEAVRELNTVENSEFQAFWGSVCSPDGSMVNTGTVRTGTSLRFPMVQRDGSTSKRSHGRSRRRGPRL